MDLFIDIVGEASRSQESTRHCGELNLRGWGRTARESGESLARLWKEARTCFEAAAIPDDEQFEGQLSYVRSWRGLRHGFSFQRTIIARVKDFDRFVRLQVEVAKFEETHGAGGAASWWSRPPIYEASAVNRSAALQNAFQDARRKAGDLCRSIGYELGDLLALRELAGGPAAFEDLDHANFMGTPRYCLGGDDLQADTKIQPVRCLCRFAVRAAPTAV